MTYGPPDGDPPEPNREDYHADEYHDRFMTARTHLRDGHTAEDAADRANIPLDLFKDALDGDPEDIRGTNRALCDGCGERVAAAVLAAGSGYSGDVETRRGVEGLDIAWCAWEDAGIPPDARPEGWRTSFPEEGFPCPNCGEGLTPEDVGVSMVQNGTGYDSVARCSHCESVIRGEDSG